MQGTKSHNVCYSLSMQIISVKFDSVAFYCQWLLARTWITHNCFVNVSLLVAQHTAVYTILLFANIESNGQNTYSQCLPQLSPTESDSIEINNHQSDSRGIQWFSYATNFWTASLHVVSVQSQHLEYITVTAKAPCSQTSSRETSKTAAKHFT